MKTPTLHTHFAAMQPHDPELYTAAQVAVNESLRIQKDEKVLIITNPDPDVSAISLALYDAVLEAGGRPVVIHQPVKSQLDFAEEATIGAIGSVPDVIISMSYQKLGKDEKAIRSPIKTGTKKTYNNTFHYLMGTKKTRAFWSPSATVEMFKKTVPIDYPRLKKESSAVKAVLDEAVMVKITNPKGTVLTFGLKGRTAFLDDGNFAAPGAGGNLPAGEAFISPENGTAQGTLVFDGSISVHDGDIIISEPIRTTLEKGFIIDIQGGAEAAELLKTITLAEDNALAYERDGRLPAGEGEAYRRNARALGELGIGLNPAAEITGNMLEDEKAYRTCHIAVGSNYDEDAPALIHLDGLITEPTIIAVMEGGEEKTILQDGNLVL